MLGGRIGRLFLVATSAALCATASPSLAHAGGAADDPLGCTQRVFDPGGVTGAAWAIMSVRLLNAPSVTEQPPQPARSWSAL